MEIERLVARIKVMRDRLDAYIADVRWLGDTLGTGVADAFEATLRPLKIGARVAAAPDLDSTAITAKCWSDRCDDISDLVTAGETQAQLRQSLSGIVVEVAWETDVKTIRQHIATHGTSWMRWLNGDYKRSSSLLASLLTGPIPKSVDARVSLLDKLIVAQKAAAALMRDEPLGREAFGSQWRRERSDWSRLRGIVDWVRENNGYGPVDELGKITAAVPDRGAVGSCVDRVTQERRQDNGAS
jgi:hypothetical protein